MIISKTSLIILISYFVAPTDLSHRLTGNCYRDFRLQVLPKLPEEVPLAVRARMWYMCDGAVLCDVLNNTYHGWWISTGGPHARHIWIPWIFIFVAPQSHCVCSSCWHHRTVDACQTIRNYPAPLTGCGGPWWDVSRRAFNLLEDILSPCYKCTLSAITHKWNVSGHMLIRTFLYVEFVPKVCPFSPVSPCAISMIQSDTVLKMQPQNYLYTRKEHTRQTNFFKHRS
jgi:hypothetical protein